MKLSDIRINCLGASNTEVTVSYDAEGKKIVDRKLNYPYFLSERLGCTVRNYGVGGTNIAVTEGRTDSYFERKDLMDRDVDVIIMQGEGNDCNHNIPLGRVGDTSPSTYCGAILSIIRWVKDEFPGARLIVLDGMKKARIARKADDCTHLDFHNAFVETCLIEKITPVSFFDDPMLDPHDPGSMPDGTHMSRRSCEYYADRVADAVRSEFDL